LQQILPKKYRMSKKRKKPAALDRPIPGRRTDDDWKPRGNKAEGDSRAYVTTNKGTMPGLPQPDEYNPGVAWWGSKRIWLGDKPKGRYRREVAPGEKTQLWKLFELLARPPGRWHSVSEIHERVFGSSVSKADMKRAAQNIRRVVSKLKRRMAEWKADEDGIIVAKSYNRRPGYVLLLLKDQKYQEGQEPRPKLKNIERESIRGLNRNRRHQEEQPGVVLWGSSKRIPLGEQTHLRKLFEILAHPPGRWRPVSEIEEFVFGTCCDTSLGVPKADMQKVQQNIRRLISRLKGRMRKHGLDHDAIIVPHRYYYRLGYMLLLIPDEVKGQQPRP
jgi:hypothetical protein